MAEVQIAPVTLRWGRTPLGVFVLELTIPKQVAPDKVEYSPLFQFGLTKEEEESLRAMLSGLVLAPSLPSGK